LAFKFYEKAMAIHALAVKGLKPIIVSKQRKKPQKSLAPAAFQII
jgi:hypothetical protein